MNNAPLPLPEDGRPAAVPVEAVAVATGEVVNSSSPSITLGPAKAVVALVASAAVAGLGAFVTAVNDNVVTPGEWATIAIATIVGSGIVGASTYVARTTVTGNRT